MTNSKKLFIIGLTIFLSVIILIVGMFYLQDISIKNSNYSFNVIFNETPGLYEGDDVKMFGKKIKFLKPRGGERFASALANVSLSNKVYKKFGKISIKNYIEEFVSNLSNK